MWKKNILKNLELEEIKFKLTREFLIELKKKFEGEDKESVKIAKLKRIKQSVTNLRP